MHFFTRSCTVAKLWLPACILFFLNSLQLHAQPAPKREFRAAWIATIGNIDWPSKPGLPVADQQAEFIRRLDRMKRLGMNAVIMQIRPAADAFYPSEIEPWSHYLTGKQGQAPDPYYDPLLFMITETHKRQMEFHAWFNPFRALVDSKKNLNPPGHITRTHPGWVVAYGGKSLLNPGIPEARAYVNSVIMDVVKRYDIDAVHLDDYFYPYKVPGVAFNDRLAFSQNNPAHLSLEDWRRNNVNLFIAALHDNIRKAKPFVKFGISPFGVWRNDNKDTLGSPTRAGTSNYDDLYADVRLWLEKGWIDYALPQLYWEHNHHVAPFEKLLPWWRDHSYGRQVYFGLGLYHMVGAYSGIWAGTKEILLEVSDIRKYAPNSGYSLYSLSNFDKVLFPIEDSLRKQGRTIALPPVMKWLDSIPPVAPMLGITNSSVGNLLKWQTADTTAQHFAIYRFAAGEPVNLELADHIITLTADRQYLDAEPGYNTAHYIVTALDRLWNESKASNMATTQKAGNR